MKRLLVAAGFAVVGALAWRAASDAVEAATEAGRLEVENAQLRQLAAGPSGNN